MPIPIKECQYIKAYVYMFLQPIPNLFHPVPSQAHAEHLGAELAKGLTHAHIHCARARCDGYGRDRRYALISSLPISDDLVCVCLLVEEELSKQQLLPPSKRPNSLFEVPTLF